MKYLDHLPNDTKENQIIPMYATAHTGVLIARDRLVRLGGISQRIACNTKFSNEVSARAGLSFAIQSPITSRSSAGWIGNDDIHRRLVLANEAYLASSLSNTFAVGLTWPDSAAAMPRAIAASSAARRVSRSWMSRTPSRRTSLLEL